MQNIVILNRTNELYFFREIEYQTSNIISSSVTVLEAATWVKYVHRIES